MKNLIKKIKKNLDILEIRYLEEEDNHNYSDTILEGLGEEPDHEGYDILQNKQSRIDLINDLILNIEKSNKELIKETIKNIEYHNKTLEEGNYSDEEEAIKEIIKLGKQAGKKLGN